MTLVRVGRRQLLLAISEHTRLPVVVPAREARAMAAALAPAARSVLLDIGVPKAEVDAECAAMADAAFAPTRSRSLLGSLNDFTFAIQVRLQQEPDTPFDELGLWLAQTPIMAPFGGEAPDVRTRRLFGLASSPVGDWRRATIGDVGNVVDAGRSHMSDPLASTTLSYAAYAEIPADGKRWEFLDGEVFVTPAPSPAHQFAVLSLAIFLRENLPAFGDDAIVFVSPIDVILNDAEIVQPDVVVARRSQVSARGIEGGPLLLTEVVSPTRPALDREVKARRYAANGVEQFWLVDPAARTVECFRLAGAAYVSTAAASGSADLNVPTLPKLVLSLDQLWL